MVMMNANEQQTILQKITNENDREIFSQQVGKADFNVIDFAEALGIKVIESKLPAKVGGYIVVKKNQWYISVNVDNTPSRKLFIIAHELGHYFLHREILTQEQGHIEYFIHQEQGSIDDEHEEEANNFAMDLLMPKESFQSLWVGDGVKISDMSMYFGIDEGFIMQRAKQLSLCPIY